MKPLKENVLNSTVSDKASHVLISDAPEFHDKPHIVQRDGGNVIVIKVRAKSHLEMKAEWFKVMSVTFVSF